MQVRNNLLVDHAMPREQCTEGISQHTGSNRVWRAVPRSLSLVGTRIVRVVNEEPTTLSSSAATVSLPSGQVALSACGVTPIRHVAGCSSCLLPMGSRQVWCACRDVNNAYDEHYDFRKCKFYVVLDNVERQLTDNLGGVPPRVFCIYVEAGMFEPVVWVWVFCHSTAIATHRIVAPSHSQIWCDAGLAYCRM